MCLWVLITSPGNSVGVCTSGIFCHMWWHDPETLMFGVIYSQNGLKKSLMTTEAATWDEISTSVTLYLRTRALSGMGAETYWTAVKDQDQILRTSTIRMTALGSLRRLYSRCPFHSRARRCSCSARSRKGAELCDTESCGSCLRSGTRCDVVGLATR